MLKDGYKDIKEILKEVAMDEGMTYTEIRDVWEHQKHYIKKKMEEKGVYSIFLPWIGTLSLNVKQFKVEIKGKTRKFYKDFIEKKEELEKDPRYKPTGNAHKRVTGVNKLARNIIRHYHTERDYVRKLIPQKECWPIIEKYSNGGYEKRDEPLTVLNQYDNKDDSELNETQLKRKERSLRQKQDKDDI